MQSEDTRSLIARRDGVTHSAPMAEYNQEMRDAAYDGEVEKMNEYLEQGADVNWTGHVGGLHPIPCLPAAAHFLNPVPAE